MRSAFSPTVGREHHSQREYSSLSDLPLPNRLLNWSTPNEENDECVSRVIVNHVYAYHVQVFLFIGTYKDKKPSFR